MSLKNLIPDFENKDTFFSGNIKKQTKTEKKTLMWVCVKWRKLYWVGILWYLDVSADKLNLDINPEIMRGFFSNIILIYIEQNLKENIGSLSKNII